MTVGQFLITLRQEAGLTQKQAAEQLGLSNKTISRWETDRGLPDVDLLKKVAELYGVTVDELLEGKRSERFVDSESDEGQPGGKMEKPEQTEARRQRLGGTMKERFHTALILLWGTMVVGTVLFVALFLMAEPYRMFPKWAVGIGWLAWMIAEGMAAAIFWMWYNRSVQTLAEESEETTGTEHLRNHFHSCFMRILIPFLVSLVVLVPLILQTGYEEPGLGYEHWQVLSQAIGSYTRSNGRIVGYVVHWIEKLPLSAMAASMLWVLLDQSGKKISAEEKAEKKKQLRKPLVVGACLAISILAITFGIKKVGLPNHVTFTSQNSFDRYVNEYLFQYNSYRLHGSHNGPELTYGVEKIDPRHFDQSLGGIDNEEYEGVVRIDYEKLTVWRIGTVVERELVNAWVGAMASILYLAILVWLWIMYYKKICVHEAS